MEKAEEECVLPYNVSDVENTGTPENSVQLKGVEAELRVKYFHYFISFGSVLRHVSYPFPIYYGVDKKLTMPLDTLGTLGSLIIVDSTIINFQLLFYLL